MKKFLIILLPFLLGSCEDFLDVKPTDQLTEENVFNTESGADLFLNTIYVTLPCPELNGSNAVIDGGLSYDNWDFMSPYNVCRYAWGRTSVYYGTYAYTASEYNPGIYNHMYPSIFFQYNYITGIYVIVIILLNLWKSIKINIRNLGLRTCCRSKVCGHIIIIYYGCIMEVFLI